MLVRTSIKAIKSWISLISVTVVVVLAEGAVDGSFFLRELGKLIAWIELGLV